MVAAWSRDDIALAGDLPSESRYGSGHCSSTGIYRQYDLTVANPSVPVPVPIRGLWVLVER